MSVPFYDVPMLYLVQQDDDTSCWFACFQMMASWKRRILKQTTKGVKGPLEDLPAGALRGAGKGLDPLEAIEYGKRLGLSPLPARSLNVAPETVYRWVHTYGPLYFAYQNFIFGGHVVVIGGTAPKSVIFFEGVGAVPRRLRRTARAGPLPVHPEMRRPRSPCRRWPGCRASGHRPVRSGCGRRRE